MTQHSEQKTPSDQTINRQLRDPHTGEPIPPRPSVGYYPGFSTLRQQAFWDDATRSVIIHRVNDIPDIRFFTDEEAQLLEAIADRLIPQDDRDAAHRIPIVPRIDERLYAGRIDGYRFADMPPDGEAHRLGLQGIEAIAQHLFERNFIDLMPGEQERVLVTIHDGKPPIDDVIWQRMDIHRYWMLLMQDCIEAYYAHPYAWDEIGFGGPAYPRGYMRLRHGEPEPWEKNEQRYPWIAPDWAISQHFAPLGGGHETMTPGQEGSH